MRILYFENAAITVRTVVPLLTSTALLKNSPQLPGQVSFFAHFVAGVPVKETLKAEEWSYLAMLTTLREGSSSTMKTMSEELRGSKATGSDSEG